MSSACNVKKKRNIRKRGTTEKESLGELFLDKCAVCIQRYAEHSHYSGPEHPMSLKESYIHLAISLFFTTFAIEELRA